MPDNAAYASMIVDVTVQENEAVKVHMTNLFNLWDTQAYGEFGRSRL